MTAALASDRSVRAFGAAPCGLVAVAVPHVEPDCACPAHRLAAVPRAVPLAPAWTPGTRGRAVVEPVRILRPPAGSELAAPVRLTRRGVAVLAVAVAVAGAVLVLWAWASAPKSVAAPPAPVSVVVQPGDTVWSIASRYAGDQDVRAVVARIQQRNALVDAGLTPGQVLRLR